MYCGYAQAELAYWRWKHFPTVVEAEDSDGNARRVEQIAEFAALVNRKFVHIVRHIMPGAGWIADIEYARYDSPHCLAALRRSRGCRICVCVADVCVHIGYVQSR